MDITRYGEETDYIYANGMRIARVCLSCTKTDPYYYHTDSLGSTRLVTDSSGVVKFSDNYQPYGTDNGTPYCQQAGCSTNHRFTGKPYGGLFIEIGPGRAIGGSGPQPETSAERESRSSSRTSRWTGEMFHSLDMFPRL